jgi:pimeloyl-ACP methyl ester carboxylesterase
MAYWDWQPTGLGSSQHAVVCVHGLSRQGRDFDVLARALQSHVRVVCPDVAGRGHSDWLADPMAYHLGTYAADMLALLAQLHAQGVQTIDWVGTRMGGLIGMALAAQPAVGLRRLVLNDVGPAIESAALLRIGTYLGLGRSFTSVEEGADYLWTISASFGPHTPDQWLALCTPMFRQSSDRWHFHYDPDIAVPFKALTQASAPEATAQAEAQLWHLYEHIAAPTLLLRGAESDLLSPATAQAMTERGPCAKLVQWPGVGHAPTLLAPEQVNCVMAFLLASE